MPTYVSLPPRELQLPILLFLKQLLFLKKEKDKQQAPNRTVTKSLTQDTSSVSSTISYTDLGKNL